jgi:hypothetical protein
MWFKGSKSRIISGPEFVLESSAKQHRLSYSLSITIVYYNGCLLQRYKEVGGANAATICFNSIESLSETGRIQAGYDRRVKETSVGRVYCRTGLPFLKPSQHDENASKFKSKVNGNELYFCYPRCKANIIGHTQVNYMSGA